MQILVFICLIFEAQFYLLLATGLQASHLSKPHFVYL